MTVSLHKCSITFMCDPVPTNEPTSPTSPPSPTQQTNEDQPPPTTETKINKKVCNSYRALLR